MLTKRDNKLSQNNVILKSSVIKISQLVKNYMRTMLKNRKRAMKMTKEKIKKNVKN
jgi:hypothetical protein